MPIGAMIPALRNAKQDGFLDCAWVVYRQALRDITENAEDSYNVIFPEKP